MKKTLDDDTYDADVDAGDENVADEDLDDGNETVTAKMWAFATRVSPKRAACLHLLCLRLF